MNVIRKLTRVAGCVVVGVLLLSSCASVRFQRTSTTTGTFSSSATAFTLFSIDFPAPALSIARGNAADSGRPNLIVEHERVLPYLGWFDWLLDIVGVRWATVSGTWGDTPTD